ncbi:MAG: HdeD family acid-resistance protein, partial [Gammaproteobacteria bacterium]|nr:HdeD family acid-resistance protein [Gammaproteobacteria bacterium]
MLVRNEMMGSINIKWRWLLGVGILFVFLGFIGLGATFALTIVSVVIFGGMLLVGGGYQFADAFRYSGWKSRTSHILIAILYVITGLIVVNDPMGISSIFTMMIAGALIAICLVRIFMAFQMRQT